MRVVNIRLLPDGSRRVRIHWFIHDERGPAKTPGTIIPTELGPMPLGGAVGRIACAPQQSNILPQKRGGEIHLTIHSDDARAVTCPECMATVEFQKQMQEIEEVLGKGANPQPQTKSADSFMSAPIKQG
jgi:hypothetical protein